MSVFKVLGYEHRLFEQMIRRVEDNLDRQSEDFRGTLAALSALFAALEKHEKIENELLSEDLTILHSRARKALRRFRRQHRAIDELRTSIRKASSLKGDAGEIRMLALKAIDLLREHFELEEAELWPRLSHCLSRSLIHSAEHRAWKMVNELERDFSRASGFPGGQYDPYTAFKDLGSA